MTQTLIQSNLLKKINRRFIANINKKKTLSFFTITLSLFSLSFFGLFAIRPTLITAFTLTRDVSDLRKLNINYENKISNIIQAQSEYEKIRSNLPLIDYALPVNAQFHKFAQAVEKFAARSNFSINQFQIDGAPISSSSLSENKLERLNFVIIATADYSSIKSFLNHLLNWKRLVTINSVDFSQEGGSESANLRFTLRGATYYEP